MARNEAPGGAAPLRLFFALWPDAEVRAALAALTDRIAAQCGGRPTPAANLHVTLAFLGPVPAERLPAFLAVGEALRGEAFDLRLDCVGYWRRARIAWAGAAEVPTPLVRFAGEMKHALEALPWPVDERPYRPHVTLVREAGRPPQDGVVALPRWRVGAFALVRSTPEAGGVRYTPLRSWPLGG